MLFQSFHPTLVIQKVAPTLVPLRKAVTTPTATAAAAAQQILQQSRSFNAYGIFSKLSLVLLAVYHVISCYLYLLILCLFAKKIVIKRRQANFQDNLKNKREITGYIPFCNFADWSTKQNTTSKVPFCNYFDLHTIQSRIIIEYAITSTFKSKMQYCFERGFLLSPWFYWMTLM